jgi:hypothetical protein
MDTHDVIDLLTIVSVNDKRTTGENDVLLWHSLIGHLDKDDCSDAIMAHFRECPNEYLKPGHVLERVRAVIRDRYERADLRDQPHMVGMAGVRRDRYGYIDKSEPDDPEYPAEWGPDERLASYWESIDRRRDEAALAANDALPASQETRAACMDEIRRSLGRMP